MKRDNYLLLFVRPVLIAVLLGIEFLFMGNLGKTDIILLVSLIAGGGLVSVIGYLLVKINTTISLYVQFTLDVILSSVILYFTGGIESPYFILYFIDIIVASIYLFAKGSFFTSVLSIVSFVAVVYLRSKFTALIPPSFLIFTSNIPKGLIFIRSYTYSLAFLTVGALSAYISEILLKGKENLQEVRITLNDIIKSFNDAIITLDRNGYIKYFNNYSKKFLKTTKSVINRNYKDILIDELAGKLGDVENIEENKFEMKLENSFYRVNINRINDGKNKIIGHNIFITNISEQKKSIEKEKEIERLRAISNLSAAVAHEIGNPLASIKGATEVAISGMDDSSDTKSLLKLVAKESNRLAQILDKFRQISRERWIEKVKDMDVAEEIKYVTDIVAHDKLFKDITFQIDCSAENSIIKGAKELNEVFSNLIRNAAQAMNYRGVIKIKCYTEDEKVSVVIEDSGEGIDKEDLENIFKPYFSMKRGGMGIGLTISKQIVEEVGGDIEVESVKGEGTKIKVKLRRA